MTGGSRSTRSSTSPALLANSWTLTTRRYWSPPAERRLHCDDPAWSAGNHTIQEVETWDEADELVALSICKALVEGPDFDGTDGDDPVTIAAMGDDAQLLAGATLAAFTKSSAGSFASINRRLARALDRSFQSDPLMGYADMHPILRDRADSADAR